MVVGAAKVISTGGVDAMSLRDLAEKAGVPFGSTYHHFPGGKAQLVDEAVRLVGAQVTKLIEEARTEGHVARAAGVRGPVAAGAGGQQLLGRLRGRRGGGRERSSAPEPWHGRCSRTGTGR